MERICLQLGGEHTVVKGYFLDNNDAIEIQSGGKQSLGAIGFQRSKGKAFGNLNQAVAGVRIVRTDNKEGKDTQDPVNLSSDSRLVVLCFDASCLVAVLLFRLFSSKRVRIPFAQQHYQVLLCILSVVTLPDASE